MTTPTVGVLALQGDVREHRAALEAAGAVTTLVRRPEELAAVDGLVLPGGESTTMVRLARVFDLLGPLREAVAGGLPVLGTCAGMILLADHLEDGAPGQETVGGLDAVVRRNAFGRQVDSFEGTVRFTPPGGEAFDLPATFIRAPWVEKAGAGVRVLARVVDTTGGDRIVAVRQGRLMATSFHPEVTGDARVHRMFVDLVADARAGRDAND